MADHKERIAALLIRHRKNRAPEVCLVTSRKHGHWMIPMGKTEKKLSKAGVARLEAYEEAGMIGRLSQSSKFKISTCSGMKNKKRTVWVFVIKVTKTLRRWPEQKERKRCWVELNKLNRVMADQTIASAIMKRFR
ncbi:NUDIX domain-containing protein [Oceanospirillum multiglobuliferum]|nr:NUDIX domain-containing protein [Oceanospirillum multiglobuliferum]SJZ90467.1 NUDIX domain-containing protein [Oceanospirillum multiglobuliferum]